MLDILLFLDVKIYRLVNSGHFDNIITSVYRKETFSGLLINWKSWCPKKYKISIIKGLHERARRLCTTSNSFENELNYIKYILRMNGYPYKFIFEMESYTRQIRHKFSMGPVIKDVIDGNKNVFVKLPYCGPSSEVTARKLKSVIEKHVNDTNLNVIYDQKKISSFFNYKDKYSLFYENNIIYRINCRDCNSFYVGETFRRLGDRYNEHLKESFGGQKGVMYSHCNENLCTSPDFNTHCSVIGKEANWHRRKIKESLLIKLTKCDLNSNSKSYSLELF